MPPAPRRKRISPWLILALFVVIIAVELVVLFGLSDKTPAPLPTAAPTAEPYIAPTSEPTPVPPPVATAVPTPVPTPEPTSAPTPSPSPSPSPSPTPQATPEPSGTRLGSGSFQSDTGTSLNMIVRWTAYENNGELDLYLDGYLSSYSLIVGARPGGVTVTLGGVSRSFDGAAIEVAGGYAESLLFSGKMTVPLGGGDMTVSYNYKGTYSDTDLPTIDAVGAVTVG